MKKKRQIEIVLLLLFLVITFLVVIGKITWFDEAIYNIIYKNHSKDLDWFFIHFTELGSALAVIIVAIIAIVLVKGKKEMCSIVFATIFPTVLNQVLKGIVRRPRPPMERRLITQGGYSYPSGHSMVSMCLYGMFIYLIWTKCKNKPLKIIATILLGSFILLIGISRIYVGVHYPSDVLAGFCISFILLIEIITRKSHHFKGE